MKIIWSKFSLFFLFMIAFIGSSLRAIYFLKLPFQYGNLVHAHSHTAFQGWVYTISILLLSKLFLTEKQIKQGRYPLQFALTVLVIFGVLISFSFQGYGLYSIIFSTLFGILNYWFILSFLKDTRLPKQELNQPISLRFIRTGLLFGLLSSLLPFAVGMLSAKGLKATEAYPASIYTFLHLQYNGWFLFITIGLFFYILDRADIDYNQKFAIRFYWYFALAVIPAIGLSFLGMSFRNIALIPAAVAVVLQVLGIGYFFLLLKPVLFKWMSEKSIWFNLFLTASLGSLFLKEVLQILSIVPQLERYAFSNKNIVLAYLHLSLLGVLTFLLIAILIDLNWISLNWLTKFGSILFLIGFILTESILVLGGLGIFYSLDQLFYGSFAMLTGIFFLLISPQKELSG